jgi:hypothetical protein
MIKNQLFGKKGKRNFNDYLDRYFQKSNTAFLDLLSFEGIDVSKEMPFFPLGPEEKVNIKVIFQKKKNEIYKN